MSDAALIAALGGVFFTVAGALLGEGAVVATGLLLLGLALLFRQLWRLAP